MSEVHILEYFSLTRIRVNIANAAVFDMKGELGLVGNEYNIALVILLVRSPGARWHMLIFLQSFVPYITFAIPGNFLLKKLRPHVWCKL